MRGINSVMTREANEKSLYELFAKGKKVEEVALETGISKSTVSKYMRRYKDKKSIKSYKDKEFHVGKDFSDEWMFWVNYIRKHAYGKEPLKLN